MGWKMILMWGAVALLVLFAAYVRLAPSDPERWHAMPQNVSDKNFASGAIRVVEAGPDGLNRLDTVARAWPRTRVLAGSVGDGMITYVTRTRLWGFPDYTTVRQVGDRLELYARSRFGKGDHGVNRARLEAWLEKL